MAEVPPPWPNPAAAATETQFHFLGQGTIQVHQKPDDHPCFLRLHGDMILSHGWRRIGAGPYVCVTDQVVLELDLRAPVFHANALNGVEVCSASIHEMLVEALALVTGDHDLLAAGNWAVDALRTPALNIAKGIARYVEGQVDFDLGSVELDVDVKMPQFWVTLIRRVPALQTEVAGALTRARKRRRDAACEPAGELCAICLMDLESEDQKMERLPCSHAFHSCCIQPWFDESTTCPTCRHDIMECFSFVRSAPFKEPLIGDVAQDEQFLDDDDVAEEDEGFISELDWEDEYARYLTDAQEYVDPEGWRRRHPNYL